ncbi:outer membrane protein assembly factor BamD [Candidatus Albibeggiatoa sp. nov. NOAA]|uniref:outer membrane protein assembly factor BamD n=1 Tax=Candidatus Albibeggiatoa sp. nov. NOAA TaxID=3162724 RepID=UPI0033048A0D|nr:outer membrane protein assembly factor BamD [Thiotrichaceae bacterium]
MKKLLLIAICLLSLASCSALRDTENKTADWTAQQIYAEARNFLNESDFDSAIRYYELLEARYPLGRYAQQAQLDMIYAYYKYGEPESAIAVADRFIKFYPRHPNIDYAYYLKGLVNFEMNSGLVDRIVKLDKSQRDASAAKASFENFSELVERFPNSKYSEDARQRMVYLHNNLARYELHVAEYYIKRGAYLAAANRAKTVVEGYPNSPDMPEALTLMAKAYKILDLHPLYEDALRVLKANYPDYEGIATVENTVIN